MSLPEVAEAKRAAGRPRCAQTHGEILEAAADLLEREPYRNISVDRIAAEAKVGKQTIYRWWETKADLVLEAYLARVLAGMPGCCATEDPMEDVRADLRRVVDAMNNNACSTAIRGLFAEAQLDDSFRARFASVFIASLHAAAKPLLRKAMDAGVLRADLDVDLAVHVLYGTIAMRFLSGNTLSANAADELIDFLMPSLAARAPLSLAAERPAAREAPAWLY
jgi:AcrR family transcriptional regulator